MQSAILEPIVQAIRKGTNLPVQEIEKHLKDWKAVAVKDGDQHVATLITKGCEMHIALVPGYKPRACKRGVIKSFLRPMFDSFGYVTTRVRHSRLNEKRFVERVGFKATWKDAEFQYYFLGSMPFERKKK